jgi:hypothetical protein
VDSFFAKTEQVDSGALLVSGAAATDLMNDLAVGDFVLNAFAHSKFIAYDEPALPLLKSALGV